MAVELPHAADGVDAPTILKATKSKANVQANGYRGKGIKKSRLGCRNCKLRKVKCDETKPKCKKCTSFGVSCNYSSGVPADLQVSSEQVYGDELSIFSMEGLQDYTKTVSQSALRTSFSPNKALLGFLNSSLQAAYTGNFMDRAQMYQLSIDDLERVHRFQNRTVLTIGSPKVGTTYQKQLVIMFCEASSTNHTRKRPYVMHAALTLTAMHDRLLNDPTATRMTDFECFHLSQAASLFHKVLQPPIAPGDRDPIWATTGIMACIAFFSTEAASPEDSWPLNNAATPTALDWLKLEDAFKLLWPVVQPQRPGGLFRHLFSDAKEKGYLWETGTQSGIEGLRHDLVDLCNMHAESTDGNNPYHTAMRNLEPLLDLQITPHTRMRFLVFCARMRPEFKTLLAQRDPRALLLMSLWYATILDSNWYIVRRARVECRSIIIYLERFHAHDTAIMALLDFPRKALDLVKFKSLPTR